MLSLQTIKRKTKKKNRKMLLVQSEDTFPVTAKETKSKEPTTRKRPGSDLSPSSKSKQKKSPTKLYKHKGSHADLNFETDSYVDKAKLQINAVDSADLSISPTKLQKKLSNRTKRKSEGKPESNEYVNQEEQSKLSNKLTKNAVTSFNGSSSSKLHLNKFVVTPNHVTISNTQIPFGRKPAISRELGGSVLSTGKNRSSALTIQSDLGPIYNTRVNSLEKIDEETVLDPETIKKEETSSTNQLKRKEVSPSQLSIKKPSKITMATTTKDLEEKYTVLKNEELIEQFMAVTMTNNQKGRIRQVLRDLLKGTSSASLPDVIHDKIQSILRSTDNLTDTDLRKIRVLYNMLNTALAAEKTISNKKAEAKRKKETEVKSEEENGPESKEGTQIKEATTNKEKKVNNDQKVKGPKRYVVFVGNLQKDVTKEQIMRHFSDLNDDIVAVRIPPPREDKKSAIAYVELKNESSYEMALSKHHSMFANKRINVLYTTLKDSKISKAEAKAKTSKLLAMVKSGQLRGSIPLKNKRSQRRARQRAALKAMGDT